MSVRSLALAAAVSATLFTAGDARAELHFNLGVGLGFAGYDPCASPDNNCDFESSSTNGPAPLLGLGLRERKELKGGWKMRYGGFGSFLYVPSNKDPDDGRRIAGSVASLTAVGGAERGKWSFDMAIGVSRIRVVDEMYAANSVTMTVGYILTGRINEGLNFFARADAHAIMHGDALGLFLGAGLEWIRVKQ
jgi:hypothetical protein